VLDATIAVMVWYNEQYPSHTPEEGRDTNMANYLQTFIALLLQILSMAILVRVLLSWVDPMANMRISQVMRDLTEPILAPIRSIMPNMMFDFSPLIAMMLLQMLGRLLLGALQ